MQVKLLRRVNNANSPDRGISSQCYCRQNFGVHEIRLCWKSAPRIDGEVFECGPWKPEGSKDELLAILEAGNQVSGDGSHWIQERDVEGTAG
jgi:hypothetical protein